MSYSVILTLVIAAAAFKSFATSASYFLINRCPTASGGQFANHSAASVAECALSCLVQGNCSVFTTASSLSSCAQGTLGQVLSSWPVSNTCGSRYRGELRDSKITGYWDFRLSRDLLLSENGNTGTFQLQGNCATSAADGLVMSAETGDRALLPSSAGTPFSGWRTPAGAADAVNASQAGSVFMRVRRRGNRGNGYFSLHSCDQPSKAAVYLWETPDNRLALALSPNSSDNASYVQWTDTAPLNPDESDWLTVGFFYSGTASGAVLWRSGQQREVSSSQQALDPGDAPSPPLCVSVGAAGGYNLTGSVRCLLVAKTNIAIEVVNAAFIGC